LIAVVKIRLSLVIRFALPKPGLSCMSQLNRAAALSPVNEDGADVFFEFLQSLAYGRLRDIEQPRGFVDAARSDDCEKRLDFPVQHVPTSSSTYRI
jgi:hypothetical protein